jgi:hypothetical protein
VFSRGLLLLTVAAAGLIAWRAFGDNALNPAERLPKPAQSTVHPVQIRTPAGTPLVSTDQLDPNGKPVGIRCVTCHMNRKPNSTTHSGAALKEFHQGLRCKHGDLTCVSCHHADDYDSLRLADNRKLTFPHVMNLCSQCHGPQARDYAHGAHGGMTGFWDLTKGGRKRNNCIDCHDPHAPAYPQVRPVFAPKDRFPPHHGKDDR